MYRQLKSRVFSSGRSSRTRTKWQGSVTRESFLKTISCSRKLSTADYKISLNETYKTNLSEKRDFHNENLRWRTKWSHSIDEKPVTHLTETLQHANPDLYPNVVTIITILLTMPVSTTTPERSFRMMRTVKTYLRSTMKTELLAALALMHVYRDIPIDVEALIRRFCVKKKGRLAVEFLWVPPRFQMFATNVSLVRSLRCWCCWPPPHLAAFC